MDNTNEDRHKQYLICFQHPARKFVAWIKKQLSNKIKNYSVRKMCEVIPTMKIQKNNLIFFSSCTAWMAYVINHPQFTPPNDFQVFLAFIVFLAAEIGALR